MRSFQDALTKEYLGVIWVTEGPLENRPEPFYSLDYFLDGLLTGFLVNGNKNKNINLFFSKSFGHPFFLVQLQKHTSEFKLEFQDILNLVGSYKGPFNRILIVGKSGNDIQSYLDSHFKKFTFDFFN